MADFKSVFPSPKPIIGMIHLNGSSRRERVNRALKEAEIYQEKGLSGAIFEDLHTSDIGDVREALREASRHKFKIALGVNVLKGPKDNPYIAFDYADEFGARFVQFDSVHPEHLHPSYDEKRRQFSEILVLGGIRFKYKPETGKSLEEDLEDGIRNCDAIVTTGDGTGIETPLDKLRQFRRYLGDGIPLISGSGVTEENIYEQTRVADGVIVGTYLKQGGIVELPVDGDRVSTLVSRLLGL